MQETDICFYCNKSNNLVLYRCDRCKHILYCSSECQRIHWPKHKVLCKQRAANLEKIHIRELFESREAELYEKLLSMPCNGDEWNNIRDSWFQIYKKTQKLQVDSYFESIDDTFKMNKNIVPCYCNKHKRLFLRLNSNNSYNCIIYISLDEMTNYESFIKAIQKIYPTFDKTLHHGWQQWESIRFQFWTQPPRS
jgi:hypothetical protein